MNWGKSIIVAFFLIISLIANPISAIAANYYAKVISSNGINSSLFTPGDLVEISYILNPSVADSNNDAQIGFYSNAVTYLSVTFPNIGISVRTGPSGNAQIFNNVVDSSSGKISDQVFFFGGPVLSSSQLGGKPISMVEVDFLSNFHIPPDEPIMLYSDALPMYKLPIIISSIGLATDGGWTSVQFEYVLTPSLNTNYLVVSPDFLFNSASQLAKYRIDTGYNASIVKLSEIASDAPTSAEIDAWIENFNTINPNLKFIALVGDVSIMPSFQIEYDSQTFYSDAMYGDNSADADYLPELVVGRIPATIDNDLTHYLDKIRRFESIYPHRNKIVFFGDMPELGFAFNRDAPDARSLGYDTVILESPSSANLYTILNDYKNDVAMVIYYGHGTLYDNGSLNQGNLADWENYDSPVIYFSGGCLFNYNGSASLPLGHALLFSDGASAASIGATVVGGYGDEYNFIKNAIYKSKTKNITAGEIYKLSINEYYNSLVDTGVDIGIGSWTYYFTLRMTFNGDPGIKMYNLPTILEFGAAYGSVFPDPDYRGLCNFDDDGDIDGSDLVKFMERFE
jgi:hypothetical protein